MVAVDIRDRELPNLVKVLEGFSVEDYPFKVYQNRMYGGDVVTVFISFAEFLEFKRLKLVR